MGGQLRNARSAAARQGENSHVRYFKTLAVIILVMIVATMFLPRNSIEVEVGDTALQVMCVSGNRFQREMIASAEIPFAEIVTVEEVTAKAYGMMVDGYSGRRGIGPVCNAGTWNWDDFGGDYQLLIQEDVETALLVTTRSGACYLFNYESAESTASLRTAIIEYLNL